MGRAGPYPGAHANRRNHGEICEEARAQEGHGKEGDEGSEEAESRLTEWGAAFLTVGSSPPRSEERMTDFTTLFLVFGCGWFTGAIVATVIIIANLED